jgi:hypothetical protein
LRKPLSCRREVGGHYDLEIKNTYYGSKKEKGRKARTKAQGRKKKEKDLNSFFSLYTKFPQAREGILFFRTLFLGDMLVWGGVTLDKKHRKYGQNVRFRPSAHCQRNRAI